MSFHGNRVIAPTCNTQQMLSWLFSNILNKGNKFNFLIYILVWYFSDYPKLVLRWCSSFLCIPIFGFLMNISKRLQHTLIWIVLLCLFQRDCNIHWYGLFFYVIVFTTRNDIRGLVDVNYSFLGASVISEFLMPAEPPNNKGTSIFQIQPPKFYNIIICWTIRKTIRRLIRRSRSDKIGC